MDLTQKIGSVIIYIYISILILNNKTIGSPRLLILSYSFLIRENKNKNSCIF